MASSRSKSEEGTISIVAGDEVTEIFLMDARLKRVASGSGQLAKNVAPGLYKVRFRAGATQHDMLAEVLPGETKEVIGPVIEFRTSAPISSTRTTHEYQSGAARSESLIVHNPAGTGGELFVFVREEDAEQSFSPGHVTVHKLDGTQIADLVDGASEADSCWSALNTSLKPGTYSVRVSTERLGTFEIFPSVCAHWQTQVFLTIDEVWRGGTAFRAPSLRGASILMSSQGAGFDPDARSVRLSELARHALSQGRQVISQGLRQDLLHEKFEDPMLGIFAAHLLLREHRPSRELIATVLRAVRRMLGNHPDVDALLIATEGKAASEVGPIQQPPSLRQGWDYIVKASRRNAALVAPESAASRIAADVVDGGPWLIRHVGHERAEEVSAPSIAGARRVVRELMSLEPDRFRELVERNRSGDEPMSVLERGVLAEAIAHTRSGDLNERISDEALKARADDVFKRLAAPPHSIASAVYQLAGKLKL